MLRYPDNRIAKLPVEIHDQLVEQGIRNSKFEDENGNLIS